jgi:hypothetical protein
MRSFTRNLFTRAIVSVLVFGLLLSGLAIYQHVLPTGQERWITIEHQIRRVLARAERDNLRFGTACDEEELSANPPQVGHVTPSSSPEVVVAYGCIFATPQLVVAPPRTFSFELSPILNL